MKLQLVLAKDEDGGLKLASDTEKLMNVKDGWWEGITPPYEAYICGKASCVLVLYTKKWDPIMLTLRLSYWHTIHLKALEKFSSL